MTGPLSCPLCSHQAARFTEDSLRVYFRCPQCELTFADPASHLGPADEKSRYDQHENTPGDVRYRAFLNRLAAPLLKHLRPGMTGLDHGCGPGPTLSLMLAEAGMIMSIYDPFYADDRSVLKKQYDFVTCTEVVEHFRNPAREWKQLAELIIPGGWLGVMTKIMSGSGPENFLRWHYRNDDTHLSFYTPSTFEWLAAKLHFHIESLDGDILLMRKLD